MFDEINKSLSMMTEVSKTQKVQMLNSAVLQLTRICFEFKIEPKEAVEKYKKVMKELGVR